MLAQGEAGVAGVLGGGEAFSDRSIGVERDDLGSALHHFAGVAPAEVEGVEDQFATDTRAAAVALCGRDPQQR